MTTIEDSEIEENIFLKIIVDKLNAIARIEDNFPRGHSQLGEHRYEPVKQQIECSRMLGHLSRMFSRNQRRTKAQRDLIKKC